MKLKPATSRLGQAFGQEAYRGYLIVKAFGREEYIVTKDGTAVYHAESVPQAKAGIDSIFGEA